MTCAMLNPNIDKEIFRTAARAVLRYDIDAVFLPGYEKIANGFDRMAEENLKDPMNRKNAIAFFNEIDGSLKLLLDKQSKAEISGVMKVMVA